MADGRVMIRRLSSADHPATTYDIVNRRGVLEANLTIPGNESIMAVTKHFAYVLEADESGGQWIRRHPWPASLK
jgi:hypothetical protein